MDADEEIEGFTPATAGDHDNDSRGVLSIRGFNTELFGMTAANPRYAGLDATDIVGKVNPGQRIRIVVSSAKGSGEDPLLADPSSELDSFEVAMIDNNSGPTRVFVTGDMGDVNEIHGSPDRDAFVRVRASFEYDNPVEAALGPFASISSFKDSYRFNE